MTSEFNPPPSLVQSFDDESRSADPRNTAPLGQRAMSGYVAPRKNLLAFGVMCALLVIALLTA